ncbi:hypothetical protein [Polyangium jinanense]|uniref:Uncharacterized protein n=1 Tax=Polyangium jinanense TaxID=2829994 RepID=A0A9X3X4I2_9BACT|nr:hypothetical protein [Polyangium jinanense]MDC3954949.1 hypothetical protein [Polyangium jinanense]MDC3981281.1 hypothetical protein [Polyangium jinanense]
MLFALFVLAPCLSLGCRSETPHASTCPAGFRADAKRAEGLLAKLGEVPAGARARDHALAKGGVSFCFGRIAVSAVTTSGAVLIDEALGTEEAAARVGHLLTHVAEGLRVEPGGGDDDCEVITARALAAEASALSLELGLRRAFGVGASARIRYEFEGNFWAAPAEAREGLVLDYLRAHPDGAPGIDALASGYARRCREARDAASTR